MPAAVAHCGRPMRSLTTILILSFLGMLHVGAQESPSTPDATLRRLLERVESLEAEVRHLRSERAAERAPAGKEVTSLGESAAEAMNEVPERGTFPQLKLRGFGDVEYHWADRGKDRNAFRLGQLDIFITSQLSENLSVLSENVIEADDDERFAFEIERLVLQYTPREYFNIAAGRYHSAIGYYNTAYHHGKWLQTAVDRPLMYDFEDEGGLLPIHNVGLSVSGAIPSGRLGLHYVAQIGNGRKFEPGEEAVQNLSDNNDFKAVNLAIMVRPDGMPGFQAGASIYFDRLNTSLSPTVNQTILTAHAVYVSPTLEWLNEGLLLRHTSDAGTFNSYGFYSQVARSFGSFRPYLRYQYLDQNSSDPIVNGVGVPGSVQKLSLGVRYDFAALVALKLQGDRALGNSSDDARQELTLQVAFTF